MMRVGHVATLTGGSNNDREKLWPHRGWAVIGYALAVVAIFVFHLFDLTARNGQFQFVLQPLLLANFAVPVALVAMLRVRLKLRVALFFTLLSVAFLFDLSAIVLLDFVGQLIGSIAYELSRKMLENVRNFAFVIAFAHGLSSLVGAFIAAHAPNQIELQRALQGRIVDWFYYVGILSLCFLIQLPAGYWMQEPSGVMVFIHKGNGYFAELIDALLMAPQLGAPVMGLLLLSARRAWGLRWLMIATIVGIAVGCVIYSRIWGYQQFVLLFLIYSCVTMISLPHWLLLRVAGYRVYSPRKWVGGGAALESSSPIAPVMESPFR